MERKGGCCLAPRYSVAAGSGGQASMAWEMGKIMLKFRPIAPKPAVMAPEPTPAAVAGGAGKGKRKAAGGAGGRRGRKPKRAATVGVAAIATAGATRRSDDDKKMKEKEMSLCSPSSSSSGMTSVDSSPPATLPLMPAGPVEDDKEQAASALLGHAAVQAVVPPASWVTVEEVTSTWRDGEAPSAAACGGAGEAPAFVSDQWGRVTWTNAAFNRAVSAPGDDGDAAAAAPEVRVGLAAKGGAATVPAWGTCAGFTCRLRVRPGCARRGALVAPCDVWRLDAGGYLWRLDLQAALSLSLAALP